MEDFSEQIELVERLRSDLAEAEGSLHEMMIDAYPAHIGDVVEWHGETYIISSLYVQYGKVRVKAQKKTKHGWRKNEVELWGFQKECLGKSA